MKTLQYVKPTAVLLKDDTRFNEAWLQARITEDPSILGLGDLDVRDMERIHPKAGRLDLLLSDADSGTRYEVEIMLGTVDESHIIRTIEYWDIERRRYPQYEHIAVLVAERLTSRFLNVISLFNGAIPLIALQLTALEVDGKILLSFTRVLDVMTLGREEEEEARSLATDRAFWEAKGISDSLAVVDQCIQTLQRIDSNLALDYRQQYIGVTVAGERSNFVKFAPKKKFLNITASVDDPNTWATRLEEAGLPTSADGSDRVRLKLRDAEASQHETLLRELFEDAYRLLQE